MDANSYLLINKIRTLKYIFKSILLLMLVSFMFSKNVHAVNVQQSISGNLTQWLLDEEHGYIYVTVLENNKVLFLRTSDLGIEKEFEFSSHSNIEIYNGKLYVLNNEISVIDIESQKIEKIISLENSHYKYDTFTIAENKIFYSKNNSNNIYVYDMSNDTKHIINPIESNMKIKHLHADKENHVLYISNESGTIFAASTLNYQLLTSYNSSIEFKNNKTPFKIIQQGNELFYGTHRINSQDLSISYGTYDYIIDSVKGDYVFTDKGIYDRESSKKIGSFDDYPLSDRYLLDNNNNLFLYEGMGHRIYKAPLDQFISNAFKKDNINLEKEMSIIKNPTRFDKNIYLDLDKEILINQSKLILKDLNTSSDYALESIKNLTNANIINGDEHGNFNPKLHTLRTQAVKVLVESLSLDMSNIPDTPTFKDIPKSHWAYPYVETAYKAGIIKGISNELFGVDELCTREQIVTMFVNSLELTNLEINNAPFNSMLKYKKDVDNISTWAYDAMDFAFYFKLIQGNTSNKLNPKGYLSNQDMAVITERFIKMRKPILQGFAVAPYTQITGRWEYNFTFIKPVKYLHILKILDENGVNILDLKNSQRTYYDFHREYKFADVNMNITYPVLEPLKTYTIQYAFSLRQDNIEPIYAEQKFVLPEHNGYINNIIPLNNSQIQVNFNMSAQENTLRNPSNYNILNQNNEILKIKNITVKPSSIILTLEKPLTEKQRICVSVENIISNANEPQNFLPYTAEILITP